MTITAKYKSPSDEQSFEPRDQQASLQAMRQTAAQMQQDINDYLTRQMQKDRARESGTSENVDEDRLEETYGEENVD